eukprot:4044693-Pyramimonas_sp.AAC.1
MPQVSRPLPDPARLAYSSSSPPISEISNFALYVFERKHTSTPDAHAIAADEEISEELAWASTRKVVKQRAQGIMTDDPGSFEAALTKVELERLANYLEWKP